MRWIVSPVLSPSFDNPPPTPHPFPQCTPCYNLFCLSIIVGTTSLLQLVSDVVFFQLPHIAHHELFSKVLQREKRGCVRNCVWWSQLRWTSRHASVYHSDEQRIKRQQKADLSPTWQTSFTSVLSVLILALCSPLTFSPIQVMRVNLARLLMASPVVILTKPNRRASSETDSGHWEMGLFVCLAYLLFVSLFMTKNEK